MTRIHYTLRYVCENLEIQPRTVRGYIAEGLVQVASDYQGQPLFDEAGFERLSRIRRMRQDLGVNLAGIDIILRLCERIEVLQEEVDRLGGARKANAGPPVSRPLRIRVDENA